MVFFPCQGLERRISQILPIQTEFNISGRCLLISLFINQGEKETGIELMQMQM